MLARLRRLYDAYRPYKPPPNKPPAGLPEPRALSQPNEARPILETILKDNILPVWYPGAVDEELGGYRGDMDEQSRWRPNSLRYIISQSRTLWFFSRLSRSPYGDERHLAAAEHGFRFLRDRMWDQEYGGFYWSIDAANGEPVVPQKSICAQSYALNAICEYALASKNDEAASLARELFGIFEDRAHDARNSGYFEQFTRDFSASQAKTLVGQANPRHKRFGTHVQIMEALTVLYKLTGDALVAARLREIVAINRDVVFDARHKTFWDKLEADWMHIKRRPYVVSYGHDVENIWLLLEASEALGEAVEPDMERYAAVFAACLRHGFDRRQGGFYFHGIASGPAIRRQKLWWVQAEALVAALRMFELTNDAVYADCFLRTLDWIVTKQVDWRNGDWHNLIAPNGRASGEKAGPWRSCYHDGRAMLRCLELMSGDSA